jgi:RimJ/RimL family protein N-acetyltransferase
MLASARLQLRRWRKEDLPAFAALNADPRVTEFLLKRLSRAESDTLAGRIEQHFARHGFGLWAVEVFGVAAFIGFTGLRIPPPEFKTHFTPCVEIAWRLAYDYWGFGYATEAALLAMDYGFKQVGLQQAVRFHAALFHTLTCATLHWNLRACSRIRNGRSLVSTNVSSGSRWLWIRFKLGRSVEASHFSRGVNSSSHV